ncbi:hypothetical protein UCDDA912_g10755 [Diaporthe ampelina]|uniref:Uncharacterized protein n=1 Tax=Diaporthe ampelina TaxID=1214573 RepID=A0A0G2F3H3_9PEZI|nr:hypothetical protein UCDDA912_g10755 [Diaporthe ampelina]
MRDDGGEPDPGLVGLLWAEKVLRQDQRQRCNNEARKKAKTETEAEAEETDSCAIATQPIDIIPSLTQTLGRIREEMLHWIPMSSYPCHQPDATFLPGARVCALPKKGRYQQQQQQQEEEGGDNDDDDNDDDTQKTDGEPGAREQLVVTAMARFRRDMANLLGHWVDRDEQDPPAQHRDLLLNLDVSYNLWANEAAHKARAVSKALAKTAAASRRAFESGLRAPRAIDARETPDNNNNNNNNNNTWSSDQQRHPHGNNKNNNKNNHNHNHNHNNAAAKAHDRHLVLWMLRVMARHCAHLHPFRSSSSSSHQTSSPPSLLASDLLDGLEATSASLASLRPLLAGIALGREREVLTDNPSWHQYQRQKWQQQQHQQQQPPPPWHWRRLPTLDNEKRTWARHWNPHDPMDALLHRLEALQVLLDDLAADLRRVVPATDAALHRLDRLCRFFNKETLEDIDGDDDDYDDGSSGGGGGASRRAGARNGDYYADSNHRFDHYVLPTAEVAVVMLENAARRVQHLLE